MPHNNYNQLLFVHYLGVIFLAHEGSMSIIKSIFYISIVLVSAQGIASELPRNGDVFLGDLPHYISAPKYHNFGTGYQSSSLIAINKSKYNVVEWIYNAQFNGLEQAGKSSMSTCQKRGYKIGAATNAHTKFEKPLDSVYMVTYTYELNCW